MFEIDNGRLKQDGVDISDSMDSTALKAEGDTLLLYAKFKASVEKAAETCFGAPKKTKAPAKKRAPKAEPVVEPVVESVPEPVVTLGQVPYAGYGVSEAGTIYDHTTGEVI